jgi:hypothetical protein
MPTQLMAGSLRHPVVAAMTRTAVATANLCISIPADESLSVYFQKETPYGTRLAVFCVHVFSPKKVTGLDLTEKANRSHVTIEGDFGLKRRLIGIFNGNAL